MKYVFKKKYLIVLVYLFDAIGYILSLPFKIFEPELTQKKDPRILLIRLDHIGDVINATSVLDPLRRTFPEAGIDLLVPSWAEDIFNDGCPLDGIIKFDAPWFSRKKATPIMHLKGFIRMVRLMADGHYDIAVDLRGDLRHIAAMTMAGIKRRISYGITGGGFMLTAEVPYKGVMHETDRNMALFASLGVHGPSGDTKLYYSDISRREADRVRGEKDIKPPYAVIHTVPGYSMKVWQAEGFAGVIDYITSRKQLRPVMVGSSFDKDYIEKVKTGTGIDVIDLSGMTDLGTLGVIIKDAALFVGIDSGPSHISASMGVPTVILFSGINDPDQWAPHGDNVRVIYPGDGMDLSSVGAEEVCRAIDEVVGGSERIG